MIRAGRRPGRRDALFNAAQPEVVFPMGAGRQRRVAGQSGFGTAGAAQTFCARNRWTGSAPEFNFHSAQSRAMLLAGVFRRGQERCRTRKGSAEAGSTGAIGEGEMAKRIYVGNLPYTSTEDDIRRLFEEHGTVNSVDVLIDRDTGRSRGFGFVEMSDEDARRAIEALNGAELEGRALRIDEARPRRDRADQGSW